MHTNLKTSGMSCVARCTNLLGVPRTPRTYVTAVLLATFFALSAPSVAGATPGIEITFLSASVRISGVTPGSRVAILTIWHELRRKTDPFIGRRAEVLSDDDADGVVEISTPPAVPFKSIWIAVDVSTTEVAIATPQEYPQRVGPGSEPYRAPSGDGLTKIRNARAAAELMLVRRRAGAWTARIYKDSGLDENRGIEGPSQIDVSSMIALGDSPSAPDRLFGNDVLVMIDPFEMDFWVAKVGAAR